MSRHVHTNATVHSRRCGHGGARRGAGRKPNGDRAGVSHLPRRRFQARHPVLVTTKVLPHVWNLRAKRTRRVIERALARWTERDGVRLVHYSIQGNHLHLIFEARAHEALARALKGIKVAVARGLNRLMKRKGTVFADRYDARVLETPRRVRNAIAYVLNNARRHRVVDARVRRDWVDPCSSARAFDGWLHDPYCPGVDPPPPVRPPRTKLLSRDWWRAGGYIHNDYVPGCWAG